MKDIWNKAIVASVENQKLQMLMQISNNEKKMNFFLFFTK